MNQLSNCTRIYIWLTIAAGLGLFAWQLGRLEATGVKLAVLAVLGSEAQTLRVPALERQVAELETRLYGAAAAGD